MQHKGKSIRSFIGAKDFQLSRKLYTDLGFKESVLSHNLSVFHSGKLSFYLQDYYTKDWVNNTMLFMDVEDVHRFWDELVVLDVPSKYPGVKQVPIKHLDWGSECFLHDPSGVSWHFGEFKEVN